MENYIGKRCLIKTELAEFEGRVTDVGAMIKITRGYIIIAGERSFCGIAYINADKILRIEII